MIIGKLFAAIGDYISGLRRDQANRDAGAAEAKASGVAEESEALQDTQAAANEADENHRADPTDNAFKNTQFRD